MLHAAAQKGGLRACLLSIGERPIAFAIGLLSNKTLHATFTGYDPEFQKYGPGLQTLLHMIEDAFEPKGSLLRLDAGCGDSAYKRSLCDSEWREAPVWIFAPSLKGLGLHVRKTISVLLHFLAMRLLENDHLRKVKNMWQRQALRRLQCEAESESHDLGLVAHWVCSIVEKYAHPRKKYVAGTSGSDPEPVC
jgi:CelD/BcsL family acetyltransferase involved in cellulose biosynthesis